MPWLDRLNDRHSRRLARNLGRQAIGARDLAQSHLQQFGRQAGNIVGSAAHDFADYGRHEGADLAREALRHYAHRAGDVAGQLASYGRHEGEILAGAAARRAVQVGRAVKADPMPAIVGAVGVALLASLVFRRRS